MNSSEDSRNPLAADIGKLSVRSDFPFLSSVNTEMPMHYLDSAATTQMPRQVIDDIKSCLENGLAPINRGSYPLAENATETYYQARIEVGRFINSPNPGQLVFTRSCTESINLVALGWATQILQPGDWVWISKMEHHANYLPWQRVCEETGAILRFMEVSDDFDLTIPHADQLFNKRTKLIAITHVSNVLGMEISCKDLCKKASESGIAILLDGAQCVGHTPTDVEALDCDFYTFSAHKMYGPVGIGALYAKPERLKELKPLLLGGGMVDLVGELHSSWADSPNRFEAGSPNLPGAVGFSSAVRYLKHIGVDRVRDHVNSVANYAFDSLSAISGVELFSNRNSKNKSLISYNVDGVHPHDVSELAGTQGIAIRAGHHCCQPLMRHLNIDATNRASFGVYSSSDDIDALVEATTYAQKMFLTV